jgi:ornithine cyclodeaminase/alanine dehydrogenase-like protein (mu-crystallin family)
MDEVVLSVEEAFRQHGLGKASNFPRTRTRGQASVLSVMHANLSYLGRAGLKAYISTPSGVRFVVLLFDGSKAAPLAVMGADTLGRFRTGAASGVATKYLYGKKSGALAVLGSGKQAFTQALAIKSVMSVDEVTVWSPNRSHRDAFCLKLKESGFRAAPCDTPGSALEEADVACTITSSREAFVTEKMLGSVTHMNIAGGNVPEHAEISPAAVGLFDTVVVDDIPQGRTEYGDLIQAADAGTFSWDSAVDLGSMVSGKARPRGRTLFKSGGAALEDVAVASMLYDKAMKSGKSYPNVELA